MSKSAPLSKMEVYAVVLADDGEMEELTAYYSTGENMFEAIEAEAKERGIRYVSTMMFQFPNEGGK